MSPYHYYSKIPPINQFTKLVRSKLRDLLLQNCIQLFLVWCYFTKVPLGRHSKGIVCFNPNSIMAS